MLRNFLLRCLALIGVVVVEGDDAREDDVERSARDTLLPGTTLILARRFFGFPVTTNKRRNSFRRWGVLFEGRNLPLLN
ncbi:hypothetical protein RRG08_020999 [Elysia crispata]|uniref:Secreted protein n=1 Tax=Elysia crispata TaxID=231223 RepID=A0AAE0XTN0_9GAST|nr:hypothetical protein RRG08_020999 [Elysia crispata]